MAGVQLAQHLAQHLGEVEVVVDIRQELLIYLAITFPIYPLQLRVVELILHLSPNMVEEILALFGWLVVEVRLEVDVLGLFAAQVYLLDVATIAEEEILYFLVGNEATTSDVLHHQRGAALLQVVAPEVVTALEGCLVINLLTF